MPLFESTPTSHRLSLVLQKRSGLCCSYLVGQAVQVMCRPGRASEQGLENGACSLPAFHLLREVWADKQDYFLNERGPAMKCEVCSNEYDKAFTITLDGQEHVFDSFECAINALAPTCEHCG